MIENKEINKSFERYPAYKDSGVEWLGEIPVGWKIRRMATLGRFSASGIDKITRKGESSVKIINYTDVYRNNKFILNSDIEYMSVTTPESNRLKHLVKKGDLISLPSSETFEDLGLSALVDEDLENVSFSYHVLRFQFQEYIVHEFKKYLLNNPVTLGEFSRKGTGSIRKTLDRNDFRNTIVLIPPLPEQTAIANFLDDKTSKIDTAIAQKEQMIELLKERKQIVIQNAVTGKWTIIDGKWTETPKEQMKDSGVEWIGDIPEGWEVKRVKQCAHMISKGTTPSTEGRTIIDDGTVRFIKAENIQNGKITNSPYHFIDEKTNNILGRSKLQNGDILFVIAGATLGKVAIIKNTHLPANTNQAVSFIRPNSKVVEGYLSIWLTSEYIVKLTWLEAVQSAQPNLSMENLGNLPFLAPPLNEQHLILNFINVQSTKIDEAITLQQTQIEKLKEYKATLIDSAVTGKIKVSDE